MRTGTALVLAALLAPTAIAQAAEVREHVVYLHENPLHVLPEIINGKLGETLRFTIENPESEGKTPHNFRVCGDGKKPTDACDEVWAFTGLLQPGQSAVITFEAKKAGTFEYYCYLPGHKAGGMVGDLVVQGAPADKGIPTPSFGPVLALTLAAAVASILGRPRP